MCVCVCEEEVYSVNKKGIEGDENKAEERTKITRDMSNKAFVLGRGFLRIETERTSRPVNLNNISEPTPA